MTTVSQHGQRLVVVALLTFGIVSGPSLPAHAAGVSCSYIAADRKVDATVEEANLAFARDAQGRILFGIDQADTQCGAATVTNTDRIAVSGSARSDIVTISLRSGNFGPGATSESGGSSEIEFLIRLFGDEDRVDVLSAQNGTVTFGDASPFRVGAFNRDGDAELAMLSVESFSAFGSSGADLLSGNGEFTSASAPIPGPLLLEGLGGPDTLTGGLRRDRLFGGPGIDQLEGGDDNDAIDSGPGADTLAGGPGADRLFNLTGDGDTFAPGPGDDEVVGSPDGKDTVVYTSSSDPVNVNLGAGSATGQGTDTLTSIENAVGSDQGDTLSGNAATNVLDGRGGGDTLQGAQEADFLVPGAGNNDVRGGAGLDTVDYRPSGVPVVVDLTAGAATAIGTDTLATIENVFGSPLRDVLRGTAGPNVLSGFGGDDDLTGLEGDDTLDGGIGFDDIDAGPGFDRCSPESAPGSTIGCEEFLAFVGTHDLKPRNATVEPGERITYRLAWTHPHRWRRLDTVELRVRDGDRVLAWVRWNQEGNTFQLFDPRGGGFTRRHDAGSDTVLTSTFARLFLRGSDAEALGPKTILVRMRLAFRRSAIGEHVVEVTAEDDRGRRDPWQRAGGLRVAR